jgi:hypothetical protein
MPKTRKFPKELSVIWYAHSDGSLSPAAYATADEALERDEQEIATYQLVTVRRGKLVAKFDAE